MEKAIDNEVNKRYVEAVECYEDQIVAHSTEAVPGSYINLAFLYWSFAFELFEFVIPYGIPEHWGIIGGDRFLKILDLGLAKFPDNVELHFWKKYLPHISYSEEFSESDCLELIQQFGTEESSDPYFFLYLYDEGKYVKQRDDLLRKAERMPTAKNLYIKSIIG